MDIELGIQNVARPVNFSTDESADNVSQAIAQAVADRQAKRLAEETDPLRRGLILGFPAQLTTMRSRLVRLLDGAFASRDLPGGILRGVYFTSGVQHGAPLDRLLGYITDLRGMTHGRGQFTMRFERFDVG